jgi:hypothetical protein
VFEIVEKCYNDLEKCLSVGHARSRFFFYKGFRV